MLKALFAIGLVGGLSGPLAAQPAGAPAATPMQPGGWGQGGWQSGTGYAVTPAPAPAAMPSPIWHGDHLRADRGGRVFGPMLDPAYTVQDWRRWGLAPPPPGARWVRYYDDAVLVDAAGTVIATRDGIAWDARQVAQAEVAAAPVYGTTTVRTGPNTTVTTTTAPAPAPIVTYAGGGDYDGYGYPGAAVTVTPGVVTTTTTTTEVTDWVPTRARHARRRCACRR